MLELFSYKRVNIAHCLLGRKRPLDLCPIRESDANIALCKGAFGSFFKGYGVAHFFCHKSAVAEGFGCGGEVGLVAFCLFCGHVVDGVV